MIKLIQNIGTKRTFYSSILAFLCALVLLVTSLTPTALAARIDPADDVNIEIDSTTVKAQNGAQVFLMTGMLKKCQNHIDYLGGPLVLTYGKDGLLFSDGSLILWNPFDKSTVITGPYVETSLTGFVSNNIADDDGTIWCSEGNSKITFLKDYAQSLGISIDEVLCNPDGDRRGFIMGLDENNNEIVNGCSAAPRYKVNYIDGEEYLESLYERWRAQNDYPFHWDNISISYTGTPYSLANASGANDIIGAYWLYYQDFSGACSFTPVDKGTENALKIVNPKTRKFEYFNSAYSKRKYSNFSLFDGTPATCQSMADGFNTLSDKYMELIKTVLARGCYDAYTNNPEAVKRWQSIVNNPSGYTDESVQTAKEALQKYNELASDGNYMDFIEQNEDEQWVCVDIGDVHITEKDPDTPDLLENDDDACANSGSKLGWILCPIITGLQQVLNTLYENIVEPMLQINVSVFNTNNGVYSTWQIFQNIANVIFVIVFLFAIFSQITGFGIDNYGIKRLLPKLIIAAILVNLSFIICQALVDVSNIVGNGAKDLLMSVNINGQPVQTNQAINEFVRGRALAGAGAATAGVVAAATAGAWAPALLIPFLLGLLSVLIAIVFMFILLGIRQAGVIILVIISPLALLMYMLPNTKSLFDKWKNLFQALLVLYPVCGLMIGGCALAGKVIISSAENFWMALLGGLLSVIPFFLIPKITKGAMAAMGKIGGMIAGLGGAASRGITGAVKGSDGYKAYQQRAFDTQNRRRAGLDKNYQPTKIRGRVKNWYAGTALGRATGYDKMQQGRVATAMKAQERDKAMEKYTNAGFIEATNARIADEAENANIKTEYSRLSNMGAIDNLGANFDENGNYAGYDENNKNSLVSQGVEAAKSGNFARVIAVAEALSSKGHSGREALSGMLQELGNDGSKNSKDAIQRISSTMLSGNQGGSFKAKARSTYDYMKKAAAGELKPGQTVRDFSNKVNFSKVSQEELVERDHEELAKYAREMKEGKLTATSALDLYNVTNGALNNTRLDAKREGKVDGYLNEIREYYNKNYGAGKPGDAQPDQEFNVNQESDSSNT